MSATAAATATAIATAADRPARRVHVETPAWPRSLAALVHRGVCEQRNAILGWGGGMGLLCALMAAIWPSIEGSTAELVENYPAGLKEAFGSTSSTPSRSTSTPRCSA